MANLGDDYGDNVEIATGEAFYDRGSGEVNLGNVKIFGVLVGKELHPVVSGRSRKAVDVKEYEDMQIKLGLDKHSWDILAELTGKTAADVSAGNADVDDEAVVLTGSYEDGDWISLSSGQGAQSPIDINTTILTFVAGGYVSCIAGDIGKPVVGAVTTDSGVLVSYDNTARTWVVQKDDVGDAFDQAEAISITGGTGAGTTAGASDLDGFWTVAAHGGSELVEGTDYILDRSGSRVARMTAGAISDGDTIYGWYRYTTQTSKKLKFGKAAISTIGSIRYTHALQNGKVFEAKIYRAYIEMLDEITHGDTLTELSVTFRALQTDSQAGEELGYWTLTI